MSADAISVGEGVVVITRRLFPEDERRHFIGRVTAWSGSMIRVEGHAWISNAIGSFERRPDPRTRLFSLATGGEILVVVPPEVDIDGLTYLSTQGRLVITDGAGYSLDISEFSRLR
jgi:hypothetical protein